MKIIFMAFISTLAVAFSLHQPISAGTWQSLTNQPTFLSNKVSSILFFFSQKWVKEVIRQTLAKTTFNR